MLSNTKDNERNVWFAIYYKTSSSVLSIAVRVNGTDDRLAHLFVGVCVIPVNNQAIGNVYDY